MNQPSMVYVRLVQRVIPFSLAEKLLVKSSSVNGSVSSKGL